MRAESLNARSFALAEIAIVLGGVYVVTVIAFTKFWGLLANDQLLAPFAVVMGVEFASACLLAQKIGILNTQRIVAMLSMKTMLILGVVMGFAAQRFALVIDEHPFWWGDATIVAAASYEFTRFIKTLDAFDIKLGPLTAIVKWLDSLFIPPSAVHEQRKVIDHAARVERRAALNEYYDTGKPGSRAVINTLSGDDIPESGSDVEAADYQDGDE